MKNCPTCKILIVGYKRDDRESKVDKEVVERWAYDMAAYTLELDEAAERGKELHDKLCEIYLNIQNERKKPKRKSLSQMITGLFK